MKASKGSSSLSDPPPACICCRVGEFSAGMYGKSTLLLDSSSSSSKYLWENNTYEVMMIKRHNKWFLEDSILTHFPHQNWLFWILSCRTMGAADFSHLLLGVRTTCGNFEGVAAPLSSLQAKIPQTQILASHPDHLCSSSWLSCGSRKRNILETLSLKTFPRQHLIILSKQEIWWIWLETFWKWSTKQ